MENIAVIKFDANSINLDIVKINDFGNYVVLEKIEEPLKISEDLERDGLILKSRIADAITILKGFNKIISVYNCSTVYPVITNILKDARNLNGFIEEIRSTTALNFKMLDTTDEAQNIYLSVINSVDCPKGIIINISSNTVQFIMYNRKQILNFEELDFGDFTLAKQFENSNLSQEELNKEMFKYVCEKLESIQLLKELDEEVQFVGVGPAFLTLAKLARKVKRYPLEKEHNYIFTKVDFEAISKILLDLGADKNKRLKGISETRADVLVSGTNIVGAIFSKIKTDKVTLTSYNYEDGVVISHINQTSETNFYPEILTNSLTAINNFLDLDCRAKETYEIAMLLFKELKVLHKLPRQYTKVLKISAYLNNIGAKLSYANKEKAALDVIMSLDILGASHHDIVLAAFIVSIQELDNFNLAEWVKYKDIMTEIDIDAVKKLAIILRLAKALDKSKANLIQDIQCDTLGDSVIVKTIVTKDASLELREAAKVKPDFKKAYNYNIEIL